MNSCHDHSILKQRTSELKSHGVTFSQKTDADTSNAINLGVDKVEIHWKHDLPEFESSFGALPSVDHILVTD